MDPALKRQFFDTLMRLKHVNPLTLPAGVPELSFTEFITLTGLHKSQIDGGKRISVADIHNQLHISKPAVSQMLGALQRRGLILREIDHQDRRKISITLTPEGDAALRRMLTTHDEKLGLIIERFGEENLRSLSDLLGRLADVFEEYKRENHEKEIGAK